MSDRDVHPRRSRSRSPRDRREVSPSRRRPAERRSRSPHNRRREEDRTSRRRRTPSPDRHRHRRERERRSRSKERTDKRRDKERSKHQPTVSVEEVAATTEDDLMKQMGFAGFDTTKNKKVKDNVDGTAKINKNRKYRQYMNRKGGFNRPLDYIA